MPEALGSRELGRGTRGRARRSEEKDVVGESMTTRKPHLKPEVKIFVIGETGEEEKQRKIV